MKFGSRTVRLERLGPILEPLDRSIHLLESPQYSRVEECGPKWLLLCSKIIENPRVQRGQLVSINGSKKGLSINGRRSRRRRRSEEEEEVKKKKKNLQLGKGGGRHARLRRARRPSRLPRGAAAPQPPRSSCFVLLFPMNCLTIILPENIT